MAGRERDTETVEKYIAIVGILYYFTGFRLHELEKILGITIHYIKQAKNKFQDKHGAKEAQRPHSYFDRLMAAVVYTCSDHNGDMISYSDKIRLCSILRINTKGYLTFWPTLEGMYLARENCYRRWLKEISPTEGYRDLCHTIFFGYTTCTAEVSKDTFTKLLSPAIVDAPPENWDELYSLANEMLDLFFPTGIYPATSDIRALTTLVVDEVLENHLPEEERQVINLLYGLGDRDRLDIRGTALLLNISMASIIRLEKSASRRLKTHTVRDDLRKRLDELSVLVQ